MFGLNLAEIPIYFAGHLLNFFRLLRNIFSSNVVGSMSYRVEENTCPVLYNTLHTALFFFCSFPVKKSVKTGLYFKKLNC